MKKHLELLYLNADTNAVRDGLTWYHSARIHCNIIAQKYGVTTELVASVMAALSPRNRWARNIRDCHDIVQYMCDDTCHIMPVVCTYGANKDKAIELCNTDLNHAQRLAILNGRKVQSFYCNILGLDDKVTIDSWIDQAYSGKYKTVKKRKALGLKRYKAIENDFISLSIKYNLKAYQIQAIVWLAFQAGLKT